MSSFYSIVKTITVCLEPILFLLNITCNALCICALSARALRASSCTHYMLAFTIFAMLYMVQVCPSEFLLAKNICWTCNPYGCKAIKFCIYVPAHAAAIMLLLASVDRFCSTSDSARLRSFNTVRNARKLIIISTTILFIYMIPALIFFDYDESLGIRSIEACIAHKTTIGFIYLVSQIFIIYICIPTAIMILNSLILHNIRQSAMRAKGERMTTQNHRNEKQITRMMIIQTSFYGILTFPYAVVYSITSLFPSLITITVLAIRDITILWFEANCFVSFLLYIAAGKVYREQLLIIFQRMKRSPTRVHPSRNRAVKM